MYCFFYTKSDNDFDKSAKAEQSKNLNVSELVFSQSINDSATNTNDCFDKTVTVQLENIVDESEIQQQSKEEQVASKAEKLQNETIQQIDQESHLTETTNDNSIMDVNQVELENEAVKSNNNNASLLSDLRTESIEINSKFK